MREAWARSVAAGIPDELFWLLTPAETELVLGELGKRRAAESRDADVRFGTVAATIVNTTPRDSRRVWDWTDFFATDEGRPEEDTPDALRHALLSWAASTPGVKVTLQ